MQKTLSIIKPDATKCNITGKILAMIENDGFRIVAQRRLVLSQKQAEAFYAVHAERPFFPELVEFMISGPIVVQALQRIDAVAQYRNLMGATNPEDSEEGTIRKAYGTSIMLNAVHGSDSAENADIEVAFFFSGTDITG